MSLQATSLGFRVDAHWLLQDVAIRLQPGTVHAVLGPNGAGKSTLLRLLSGELAPSRGEIALNGRALPRWTPQQQALQRAVLPQSTGLRFGFTAAQVVALGRLPCPRHDKDREQQIVMDALSAAGVAHLAGRRYPSLSGGERARVQFARVMAQVWEPLELGPRYLLMDEPTASLDLAHQHDCLRQARRLAATGCGVLVILHDPNLAMAYADEVTLLRNGRLLASGATQAVLSGETLSGLYGTRVRLVHGDGLPHPLIQALP